MGRVRLTMNEVAAAGDAGITKVFTLLNENFEFSETNRGDINISLKWIFDQATDDLNKRVLKSGSKSGIFTKITNLLKRKQVPPKVEVMGRSTVDCLRAHVCLAGGGEAID